jgi:nucleoside-diphosphate-sugar epimerase
MHALVTGGGGFLGRYIVDQLVARVDRVRSFGRGEYPELSGIGVEVVRGDIREPAAVLTACRGVDCVFHVAALPGIGMQFARYDQANRVGTLNVIAACQEAGVNRLVYTSSPSVVFAGEDQCGVDEAAAYDFDWMRRHRAYYSLTKAQAEEAVLAANEGNVRTCALRPHLIWGPRDTQLIPRLIARARAGRLRRVGDGTNLVDIAYVENVADAHLQAADALLPSDSTVGGKAYFLSQGEPVNCWQWIDEILALVNLPPVGKSISFRAAWRVGALCEGIYRLTGLSTEPPMTRFLAAQLARSHWFDISAAKRDFGYTPRVSTEEGMRRLGEWLRANSSTWADHFGRTRRTLIQ